MQLPFGRYTGLCTQQWERTHAKSIIGDGGSRVRRRGGGRRGRRVNVESCKGAFAVFLIFGAVVMKIASKLFLSLRGAGHLEVCLAGEEVTEGEK